MMPLNWYAWNVLNPGMINSAEKFPEPSLLINVFLHSADLHVQFVNGIIVIQTKSMNNDNAIYRHLEKKKKKASNQWFIFLYSSSFYEIQKVFNLFC